MSKEIKEILDELESLFEISEAPEHIINGFNKLKDYITNLQQKVEQLEKENEKLKQENKRIFQNVNDDELLISNAMNYAEVQRLNNIINQADTKNLELIQKINKIYDVIENENITGIEARLLIQDILDKEE